MARNVRVEWRQGETGLGSVYIFNPNPNPSRPDQGFKQVEFDVPLRDGVEVQDLGVDKRIVTLRGVLYAKTRVFEDLEDQRRALIDGIGRGPGQLHLISLNSLSNSRHIYYIGQITAPGIVFDEQTNPMILDYTITLLCAEPGEFHVSNKTITSNAEII